MSVRVVQYNVLAPKLCNEDDFTKSVGHCDEEIRWERIIKKLTSEIERKSIIALQEVGRKWGGRFHTFFNSREYRFIYQGHGNEYSDFMGQAIAFHESFELLDARFLSPFCPDTTNFEEINLPKPMSGYFPACVIAAGAIAAEYFFPARSSQIATASLGTLFFTSLYFHLQEKKKPLSKFHIDTDIRISVSARSRDVMPMVKLKAENGSEFWVSTNHMPCKFKNPPLMTVFTALTAKAVQDVAQSDPYILAGDFNQDPTTDSYKLLTDGCKAKLEVDVAKFLPKTEPMRSAYAVASEEPEYTNYCERLLFGEFVGTLDFIWVSTQWDVLSVDPVPDIDCDSWPSETEPSDHCMIAANLKLKS